MTREIGIATDKGIFSYNYVPIALNLSVYISCINIYKITDI